MSIFRRGKSVESTDGTDQTSTPLSQAEAAARQKLHDDLTRIASKNKQDTSEQDRQTALAEAQEEVERLDPTEIHQYLRAAQEFITNNRHDAIEYRTRIKLAIGYATIGEIEEAKKLIEDAAVFSTLNENGFYINQQEAPKVDNDKDDYEYSYGERERIVMMKKRGVPRALAAVAYYSRMTGDISTVEDVARYAEEHSNPTGNYQAHELPKGVFKLKTDEWQTQVDAQYAVLTEQYKQDGLSIIGDEIKRRREHAITSADHNSVAISNALYVDLLVDIALDKFKKLAEDEDPAQGEE